MPKWRSEYRRCDNCRSEYRPKREAQSYCSRDCRRAAAYGRERFNAGTLGRRKRRLEASDKLPGTLMAGSFRKGDFSSIETGSYRPTDWIEELNQAAAHEIDQPYRTREKRTWPLGLIGGQRHAEKQPLMTIERRLRPAILNTERVLKDEESTAQPVNGDDFQLEYYPDGHPKLPERLDRRFKFPLLEAA
jgi:hypothetical protein